MNPTIDAIRDATRMLERIAVALERVVGVESPQTIARAPATAAANSSIPITHRQGEPVRAPIPPALAARGEPPPAKRAPFCSATGPVFVGSTAIRCSEDKGHNGPHSHAGYEWPNEPEATEGSDAPKGENTEPAT